MYIALKAEINEWDTLRGERMRPFLYKNFELHQSMRKNVYIVFDGTLMKLITFFVARPSFEKHINTNRS